MKLLEVHSAPATNRNTILIITKENMMKTFINSSPPAIGTRGNAWQAMLPKAMLLGALLAVSAGAQAAGTTSGTSIANLAKLTYSVGGTPQNEICSSEAGNSTGNGGTSGTTCTSGTNGASSTTFTVDNKVDVLVTQSSGTATSVVAGQASAVSTFTVKNEGNTSQDFSLFTANLASGSQTVSGVTGSPFTDNFNTGSCTVAMSGTTGSATFSSTGGDHLNALAPDEVATVTVTCSIPLGKVTGDAAVIYLGATARVDDSAAGLGGALTASVTNNQNGAADIVFADDAGSDDATIVGSGTGDRDATHSARGVFVVSTSALTVTKTMTTVCDPVNGTSTPFNIPGALVKWQIVVANGSGAGTSATLSAVSDALNANTTMDADFEKGDSAAHCAAAANQYTNVSGTGFRVSCVANVGGTRACHSAAQFFTSAADTDGADLNGSTVDIDYSKVLPGSDGSHNAGELKPGESVTVQFQVFIN